MTTDSSCQYCGTRCSECSHFDKENKCLTKEPWFSRSRAAEETPNTNLVDGFFLNRIKTLSHNRKGYDGYFLLEYLVDNSIIQQVIYSGSNLMYISVAKQLNIRILDFYNFLPTKLSKLPSAFDLSELKKGYFPHFLNTFQQQNYVGPYPDSSQYGCDTMSDKDRSEFLTCHQ